MWPRAITACQPFIVYDIKINCKTAAQAESNEEADNRSQLIHRNTQAAQQMNVWGKK